MLDWLVGSRLSASEVAEKLRTGLKKSSEGNLMQEEPEILLAEHVKGDSGAITTD